MLVERKVCFILETGSQGEQVLLVVQRLTPLTESWWARAFIDRGRGLHADNSTVSSDSYLEIGHWWSDQHRLDCFKYDPLRPYTTLWIAAHQAALSKGFSRQEYQSGLPFASPGDLPHPETQLLSLNIYRQVGSLPLAAYICYNVYIHILKLVTISFKTFVKNHEVVNLKLVNMKYVNYTSKEPI